MLAHLKKTFFFGRPFPNLVKFWSKKAIFGVIWFFLRGLDLVWESATHIWERSPKKTFFLFDAFPNWSAFRYSVLTPGPWALVPRGKAQQSLGKEKLLVKVSPQMLSKCDKQEWRRAVIFHAHVRRLLAYMVPDALTENALCIRA